MTTHDPTDERKTIYKEYRTAKKNLKKGRDFIEWMKIARGYDEARREAMQRARTNQPQGPSYRKEFAEIDRRENLIDRDENGKEFPSGEERALCIRVLENYDAPSYDPRRPSLKAWRDGLLDTERAKFNHPKRVWERYWSDTEPQEEKAAKRIARETKAKVDQMTDLIADTESARNAAQRQVEAMRELLAAIRNAWADIPDHVAAKIDAILSS
jgi:hypothetical protein